MAERIFVDTNVLLYAHDASDPGKQAIAAGVLAGAWSTRSGILSTQVLQEFYAVATRKWTPALPRAEARQIVVAYGQWPLVLVDAPLIIAASELEEKQSLSFWDALIVEAARRGGASVLLTEDLQHDRAFGAVQIQNPFLALPRA